MTGRVVRFGGVASGYSLDEAQGRGKLQSVLRIRAFVPDSLVRNIGNAVKRGRVVVRKPLGLKSEGVQGLTDSIIRIPQFYQKSQESLLNAVDNLLADPRQDVEGGKRRTRTYQASRRVKLEGVSGLPARYVVLAARWRRLTDETVKIKLEEEAALTYWKHSGRASAEFRSAKQQRLVRLRTADFIGAVSNPEFRDHKTSGPLTGGQSREVRFTVPVGIPFWNREADALFITPLVRGRAENAVAISGAGRFRGSRYLVAPESTRPWLARLGLLAHQRMKTDFEYLFRKGFNLSGT